MSDYIRFKRLVRVALFAAAVCAGSAMVWAQGPGGGGRMQGQMFAAMDANGDGKVSRTEWDDFHAKRFGAIDANKDGAIDAAEFRAKRMPKGKQGGQ